MGTDKQAVGILDTINMETVRTILTHTYPYPHEHSRHAIIAVAVGCLFFISSDNMHTLIQKLDKNIKWWSIYACLLGIFYFFSSPFVGKTIKPSYSNFSRWYVAWILVAALYHLPSFQSMGVDMRMNLSLFLTIFISSIFVLLVFHLVFLGLWYIGLVSRVAGRRPEILTILQNCAVLSVACCVFYSHCGNHALNEKPFGRKDSGLFSLWRKGERSTLVAKFLKMYEFKDEVCKSWFAPVGSARDYPLLSKWVIYGEAAMSGGHEGAKQEDFLYDHFSERDDFWFDFMADTGDGGNSSYSVARLLAQPSLRACNDDSEIKLHRGNLLLIGGDLAYPNPSAFNYEKRFFRPFEYALQPPSWYREGHVAVNKPELPCNVSELKQYDGPQCFVIPGNHDWFDGLQTFMRYICHKSWLGGWLMPQKKSYFALQLPKGWWVFGLDLALHCDIDSYQFKFFTDLILEKVKENDSVIIMTHEPNWILDWYWDDVTGKNVSHLICDYLKGRCKLQMAGDLHHYMRHSYISSENPVNVQHLLVNGCGGAFLHPTHCKLDHILQDDTISGHIRSFFSTVWDAFMYMVGQSYISSVGAMLLLVAAISFVPSKVSRKRKIVIGVVHVLAHLAAALVLMLLMELGVITRYISGTDQWKVNIFRTRLALGRVWSNGLSAFIQHVMAVTRTNICKNGMVSLSRGGAIIYYASVFLYFWVFSTPVVSLIFGSYLYICINWLHLHFDEAFSSLRIANYKSFTRFHIRQNGNLEVFTLAVDKVPKEWKLDLDWDNELKQPHQLSHHRKYPSKWRANSFHQDPVNSVRIVDQFVIQTDKSELVVGNGSVSHR
ncbi:hypothetical protein Ccrd_014985 [Cynara cardunculus var. scolymus]|uniref:Calcineurin-like phosphoesterase domain-containing protein n=1 Tax=Cynara cardunculus var. scolymus TaxID=59895 RepID=A0A118K3Y1_CYNCS|nr:hypothetical protein Ccrd_014985 [Cynara cardunculus var. scolymus]